MPTPVQLTATAIANLSQCAHLVTLEVDVLRGTRKRPNTYSSVTDRLIGLGAAHEEAQLATYRADGKSVIEIDTKISQEAAAKRTLAAMKEGADVIYQGALRSEGWFGRTDFLLKVATPSSVLGAYSYEVVDTKLSQEARARALLQLCLYSQLLEEVQGVLPASMHIVLGDKTQETFSTRSYLAYFRSVVRDVKDALLSPTANTYPAPNDHCEICPWEGTCDKQWRDDDDLSLVAGLSSRHRELFRASGTSKMANLGKLPIPKKHETISITTLTRLREQARIQCEGRDKKKAIYELLDATEPGVGLLRLPTPSVGDLFVDLEGDPMAMAGGIEYLTGVVEVDPARPFIALWGTDRAGEKKAFEAFMKLVKERRAEYPDMHLYHYAPYEPAAFKRLAARHGTCVHELDVLLRENVFVDLYGVVRQGVRASVESYSIKKLEPLYNFTRKANLKDAGSCLVAMATWFDRRSTPEPDAELKEIIAAYNEDDCVSTRELRDWLEVLRAELEKKHGKVFARPTPGESASDEHLEQIEKVAKVVEKLTRGIPVEETERTKEQHATWLVAQMLDWHKREDKSAWWEFFRLKELSEEELIDEPGALAGLVYDGIERPEKRSLIHRYRFPEQDVPATGFDNATDVHTGESAGTCVSINEETLTVLLKRGATSDKPHPRALIDMSIVGTPEQRDSLFRFGEWVAKHGIGSALPEYRAARALLLRSAPLGLAGGPLKAALAIDGSVLPVQGPPGAGKTHMGADMIVALVKAGKKVGIVANSHKVIGNLLKKACTTAAAEKVNLRAVQKGGGEDDGQPNHPFVTNAKSNDDVLESLNSGFNVAAGTSWLWSREEMANAVDVLFVDEAGQISLANVVACAQAADGLVLLGDPQQLDQPLKGVHPPGADASALGHVLGEKITFGAEDGIFLGETWRMHPDVCSYISEVFYEAKLHARPNLKAQCVTGGGVFDGVGLRMVPVEHRGNTNESAEEAKRVGELVKELLASGATWTNGEGTKQKIAAEHVLVITPYNAQVAAIKKCVPEGVAVGTVDKFQGQEAPIAIYSLATSTPEDAPRGMEFLYSKNRLNVAISRARCVSVIVGSPALLRVKCKTPRQMELANALCRFAEVARDSGDSSLRSE